MQASAARSTGVASRRVLRSAAPVRQGLGRDLAVDDYREDEGAAGDLCVVERAVGDLRAIKCAAGHLRAGESAAGDLDAVERAAGDLGAVDRAATLGGEVSGGTLMSPALPAPGGRDLVVDARAVVLPWGGRTMIATRES